MDFIEDDFSVSDNDFLLASVPATAGWDPQILQAFDLLVSDFPSHYGYIAFNSDGAYYLASGTQYSVQGSTIYFGPDCKVAILQNDPDLTFNVQNIPNYTFTLESGSLAYTNLLSGYPDLRADNVPVPLILGFGLIVSAIWACLSRYSRR